MSQLVSPEIPATHSTVLPQQGKRGWTAWQVRWAVWQILAVAGLFGGRLVLDYDYTSVLFTTDMGVRMLLQGAAMLAILLGGSLGACLLLDLKCPGLTARQPGVSKLLTALLGAVQLILGTIPMIFVVMVGPAAIRITLTMLQQ